MLKDRVSINGKEYQIKPGTYVKRKANSVVPRFSNQALSLSDMSTWVHWGQSLWHGGFYRDYIDTNPPIGFLKSENLDVFSKIGSIRRVKDLSASGAAGGSDVLKQPAVFTVSNSRYIYFGGQGGNKLWRTVLSAAPVSVANISATLLSITEYVKNGVIAPRLYLGTGNTTNVLKYTTDVSLINDTNFSAASGQPTSMRSAEGLLWLINTKGLFTYDLSTVTNVVANPDVAGNRGAQMEYHSGNMYWIGYANSTGRLYRYDIVSDEDVVVYEWPGNFKPYFIKKYRNKLVIGGKDLGVNAAAIFEYNPLTDEIRTIQLWANADDEDTANYAHEFNGLLLIQIDGSTALYVYAYNGTNLANYIKGGSSISGAMQSTGNKLAMFPANKVRYSSSSSTYQTSGSIESSKIDFDLFGVNKYIDGLIAYFKPLQSGSYIKIKTRVDRNLHWSAVPVKGSLAGTTTVSGQTSLDVQLASAQIGKKLEYYVKVSATNSKEIEIEDIVVRYLVQPENKLEWFFDLILADNLVGNRINAETMAENLRTAMNKVVIAYKDIDNKVFDSTKGGVTDRGVIVENIDFLGPYPNGEKIEYIARVHLIQG